MVGRTRHRHAVGNHPHLLGRRAVPHVEIAHAFAVDHHAAASLGQRAIQRQLQPALPRIDAALADHDVLHAARPGRRKTVGVGGEHPGVDQVGPKPGDVLLQPPKRLRIELPSLADDRRRDARLGQIGRQRPAAGQGADMHVELVARQPAGQQAQLFLGAGAVERRDDLQNAFRHGAISFGSNAARYGRLRYWSR